MFAPKTALGIDVSDGRINLALLKKSTNSVKLLKTAAAPVPDGAIKDGNIEDAMVLAKAIKKLKAQNRIRSHPTAMSLLTNPVLMQILDMPDKPPGNLRQFVRDQVKHYAVLPMNKAAIDFCGVSSAGSGGSQTPLFAFGDPRNSRALVVATDNQKLTDAARILHREGLNLDAIEPASLAYIRACYAKKIEKKFDRNLLFAIAHGDILTLCLFKNQALDFIRTKRIEPDIEQSDKYFEWLTEEIYTVIQFYELEVLDKRDEWEVTLITNLTNRPIENETGTPFRNKSQNGNPTLSAGANVEGVELKIRTLKTAYLDSPVADTKHGEKPSAIAVGLAMKLLDNSKNTPDINLLPLQVAQAKTTEKQVLISANAAAVIFFLMIVSIGIFNVKAKKVQNDINQKAQAQEKLNMHSLLSEQASLNGQSKDVSSEINRLDAVLDAGSFKRWDQILNDISSAIPRTVRLTRLSCEGNSKMLLAGLAVSYEAIHRFVDTLSASKHIESALFLGAEEESQRNALLNYSVGCSLGAPSNAFGEPLIQ